MKLTLLDSLYRLCIDRRTHEPRRLAFFLLYYVTGFSVAFIVGTTILLCLEVYHLTFLRNFLYRELGEAVLRALERMLY